MIGRLIWLWLEWYERTIRAAIEGAQRMQPAVWPKCQIDGCDEEASVHVGREGAQILACFKHAHEYMGVR